MEVWDAYYADGTPAGIDLIRGEPVPDGLYHMVSEILVRHTNGDYLLMKRDPRKTTYGGYEEATAGGSAIKGEDASTCAMRELREETGITASNLSHVSVTVTDGVIYHAFLCVTDCEKNAIKLQEGETVSFRWIGEKEFIRFFQSAEMIPHTQEHYRSLFENKTE